MMPERGGIESKDFISSLPDGVLHHIISFVPTELAIQTCVLSKRWRHIWREVPYISLDCDEGTVESVNKTLDHHTARKLLSFHLAFRFDAVELEIPKGYKFPDDVFVGKWIDFAISRDPENLSLDFLLYHYQNYSLPDNFYVSSSVKRLSLVLHTYTTLTPRSTVFWPSLKTLCLDGCNIPDESAAKILSGCPVLESLALNSCKLLGRLDLSESMHVTRLEINHHRPDSGPTEIVAPHIHYLRLETTNTPPCSLDHVSSLTHAKLNLLEYWGNTIAPGFLRVMDMLPKLHNIEKLTLGPMFLQVLSVSELSGVPFPTLKIKDLTLETGILRYFLPSDAQLPAVPGIAKLLRNSPELKKLTLNLYKSRIVRPNVQENSLPTYIDSRGLKCEVVSTSSEPKLIALFIELVLGNTKTLETLVVRLEDNIDAERFELLQMVQKLSHDVTIVIKHNVSDFEF